MMEIELNQADRKRIKDDIKLALIMSLLFGAALIVLIILAGVVLSFFFNPADGIVTRGFYGVIFLLLPIWSISGLMILKHIIDLRKGKKSNFRTEEYEIKEERHGFVLVTSKPLEMKFNLYHTLHALLILGEPITIETTRWGKTLLSISQDGENLLERLEREEIQEVNNDGAG